jgi:hypothetical protein
MRTFTIDSDHNIAVYASAEEVPAGDSVQRFTSEKELGKLLEMLNGDELIQVWNSFAGVAPFDDLKPVKKFTDRKTAVARIWKAVQRLGATKVADAAPQAADNAPKKAEGTKGAKAKKGAPQARKGGTSEARKGASVARGGSKKAIVLDLLSRKDGATLAEIAKATNWQNHSIRGFISGTITKKMGLKVDSSKDDKSERRYRIITK